MHSCQQTELCFIRFLYNTLLVNLKPLYCFVGLKEQTFICSCLSAINMHLLLVCNSKDSPQSVIVKSFQKIKIQVFFQIKLKRALEDKIDVQFVILSS